MHTSSKLSFNFTTSLKYEYLPVYMYTFSDASTVIVPLMCDIVDTAFSSSWFYVSFTNVAQTRILPDPHTKNLYLSGFIPDLALWNVQVNLLCVHD